MHTFQNLSIGVRVQATLIYIQTVVWFSLCWQGLHDPEGQRLAGEVLGLGLLADLGEGVYKPRHQNGPGESSAHFTVFKEKKRFLPGCISILCPRRIKMRLRQAS